MLKSSSNCQIPVKLVPICLRCGEAMEVNLRKDAFFVEDTNWHTLNNAYEQFISANKDKKLLLIELGVGFNTPGIIRFPFEKMTHDFKNTTLIRVNNKYPDVAFELKDKCLLIKSDCQKFIDKL